MRDPRRKAPDRESKQSNQTYLDLIDHLLAPLAYAHVPLRYSEIYTN
jgi:hypothetical protein